MTRLQKTFCWLIFIVGIALLALAAYSAYYHYEIVKHWPPVRAVITRSRVVYASELRRPRYLAEFNFAYRVNGVPYNASESETASDYRDAQELVSRHPAGSMQILRYNPKNPADIKMNAAFRVKFFKLPLMLAGVSLACIFVGGLPLWRGRRRFTREQITCPNCQRTMDKGRRHCPYCKEELVKY